MLNLNRCDFHCKRKEQVHIRPKFRKGRLKKTKSEMQNKIDASSTTTLKKTQEKKVPR